MIGLDLISQSNFSYDSISFNGEAIYQDSFFFQYKTQKCMNASVFRVSIKTMHGINGCGITIKGL